jgi:predicted glycosyltransferase
LKILVDMLTPKQVLFLGELSERLEDAGHRVIRVSRDFPETLQLLRMKRIKARIIGEHRLTLEGKLQESLRRTAKLARLMRNLGVDLVVAYPSVEAARSAFGLSVPYYCASDSPHAEAVSRLTIPLAAKLFSPAVIPKEEWIRYGIATSNIIQYNALDPYVWVRKAKPEPKMIQKLGLELNSRVVTLRLEESFAAYLMKTSGDWRNLAVRIVKELLRRGCETKIVVLPRYRQQYEAFRDLRRKVIIPKTPVLGSALLASTSVFIGGGGTMTAEAALMGVPTISYFPAGPTRVESYLREKGLLTRLTDPESIAEQTVSWLNDEAFQADSRTRAQELLRSMEDPLRVIVDNINP